MSKMIVIKKGVDKIVLLLDNKHIADITIAHSSRTSSVNLSIQADMNVKIEKSKFGPTDWRALSEKQLQGRIRQMSEQEQMDRRQSDHDAIMRAKL